MATVGVILVNVTVELVEQVPFVMVHLKTAGLEVTVTAVFLVLMLVIVAAPLTTDQVPVSPAAGALAAIVNALFLHFV